MDDLQKRLDVAYDAINGVLREVGIADTISTREQTHFLLRGMFAQMIQMETLIRAAVPNQSKNTYSVTVANAQEDEQLVGNRALVEELTKFFFNMVDSFRKGKKIEPTTFQKWAESLHMRLLALKDIKG